MRATGTRERWRVDAGDARRVGADGGGASARGDRSHNDGSRGHCVRRRRGGSLRGRRVSGRRDGVDGGERRLDIGGKSLVPLGRVASLDGRGDLRGEAGLVGGCDLQN